MFRRIFFRKRAEDRRVEEFIDAIRSEAPTAVIPVVIPITEWYPLNTWVGATATDTIEFPKIVLRAGASQRISS